MDCTVNLANCESHSTLKTLYPHFLSARQRENAFPQRLHRLALMLVERVKYGTNPELMPGCVRAFILMAYQTPRDFQQILTEYREALKASDWEPSPYHSHDQYDFDIFIMGKQDLFEISSYPLREDILQVPTPTSSPKQAFTIYYLQLSHYDPAIKGCSG